jgi:hypothetical protein
VEPGDTVCVTGTLDDRLNSPPEARSRRRSPTPGVATPPCPGITARADHIVIEGFIVAGADDNAIYASGNNITLRRYGPVRGLQRSRRCGL